jgi:hypothetical protein
MVRIISHVKTVTITRRALVQRINRVLRKKKQALKSVGSRRKGRYARIDLVHGTIIEEPANLSKVAKELGVLKSWERFVEDV